MTGDDYYQAHLELYESLMAANPAQLEELATSWGIIGQITTQISDTLNDYLGNLPDFWNSTASEEYQRRLNLITTYANALSKQQKILQDTIDTWSGVVLNAQAQAESPEEVDTAAEAAYDDYMTSTPTAVINEWAGMRMSDNARRDAYYRLVTLVDDVSTEYEAGGQRMEAVAPDPDLPGTDAVMTAGTSSGSGTTYSTSKLSTSTAAATTATAASVAAAAAMTTTPVMDTTDTGASPDGVTTLAGADGSGVIGLAAAASAAASGGAIYSQISLAPTAAGATGGMGTTGLGITASGTTIPAGGVLASSNTTGLKTPNPTLAGEGANRANTPTNRTNLTTNTTRTGTGGPTDHDDDTDEHTTWLTEDDMIWGDEELDNIPPAAIE